MDEGFIHDLFAPFGEVRTRRMFGGVGVYRDGVMFALAADGELYLKSDAESAERFRAAGSQPFEYEQRGRKVALSYWRLPEEALDDPAELEQWARLAYQAALKARPTGKRR
ncbi:MAG TPA: TfoX/Sxy family protein [Afifellaceae bacterium]|nr:TfoX/Sxy family protein [Afifellaceae bacterium]